LLTAQEARALNPALRGTFTAALWCERDAAVEPRTAQLALKAELLASGRYTYLGGREVRDVVGAASVRDDHGDVHTGDAVILAT
ncbi:FAD-dependent oxidoreductase, partial [Streptomyces sp. SID8455]|nr:FAD-dependent oxidoreductase [Streptomyces sp. SID8455]